jgi:hypothetical protein
LENRNISQPYPDFGSQAEIFTDHRFLELETLGPLASLAPGAAVEHVEEGQLFEGEPNVETDSARWDEDVRSLVEPAE